LSGIAKTLAAKRSYASFHWKAVSSGLFVPN
jgi:hypothetical protein